jgi:hypothetical protein
MAPTAAKCDPQVAYFRQSSEERGCALTELASGIDALYLSGRAAPPEQFLDKLEASRLRAQGRHQAEPLRLGDTTLLVEPHGFGRYRYCLRHEHCQIGLSPSHHLPAIRLQPRSAFLHAVGPADALEWLQLLLEPHVGPIRFSVARLDLFADFQGWQLGGDDRHRFVVRGKERDTYEDGQELSGFVFGRRSTNTVLARIYDKQREMLRSGADYWPGIWGERYDPGKPVHRVEFELGRTGLREYGIDTPGEAIEAAGALWASLTETWLTYRSPTSDETRARWPLAPEWRAVQHASIRGGAAGLERIRQGKREGDLRRLMPRLVGELASFAVIVGTEKLSDTLASLLPAIHQLEAERGVHFEEKVARRRLEGAQS